MAMRPTRTEGRMAMRPTRTEGRMAMRPIRTEGRMAMRPTPVAGCTLGYELCYELAASSIEWTYVAQAFRPALAALAALKGLRYVSGHTLLK